MNTDSAFQHCVAFADTHRAGWLHRLRSSPHSGSRNGGRERARTAAARRAAFASMIALLAAHSNQAADINRGIEPVTSSVTGIVAYLEPLRLSASAVLEIVLQDVTLPDAPSPSIAARTIRPKTQTPIAFVLPYDPGSIDPTHEYAVTARISDPAQKLLWINASRYSVLTRGNRAAVAIDVQAAHDFVFACKGLRLTVRLGFQTAQIGLTGRTIVLPAVAGASGAVFSNSSGSFRWREPNRAVLKAGGRSYRNCARQVQDETLED